MKPKLAPKDRSVGDGVATGLRGEAPRGSSLSIRHRPVGNESASGAEALVARKPNFVRGWALA